jgi:hypothetical protein
MNISFAAQSQGDAATGFPRVRRHRPKLALSVTRLLAVTLLLSLAVGGPIRAQVPQELTLKGVMKLGDGSIGELHYDPQLLGSYALTPGTAASIIENSFRFHQSTWPRSVTPVKYFVYLLEHPHNAFDNLANTASSPTGRIAGAPVLQKDIRACVSVIYLANVRNFFRDTASTPFEEAFAFTMTHELAHCFQRVAIPNHEETISSPQSDWMLEGSASWLARKFVVKTYGGNPQFYWPHFVMNHKKNLLTLSNEALVFFSFLETNWGLGGTPAVISFLTDGSMPKPTCTKKLDLTTFPDYRSVQPLACAGISPYLPFLVSYFQGRQSLEELMSAYAVALARGDVLGAPPIRTQAYIYKGRELVDSVTHSIDPKSGEPTNPGPIIDDPELRVPRVIPFFVPPVYRRVDLGQEALVLGDDNPEPLGVLLLKFGMGSGPPIDNRHRLGDFWYEVGDVGPSARVDVTQVALNGKPGTGLSWRADPKGATGLVRFPGRPPQVVTPPNFFGKDFSAHTDDFVFTVTRTAIDAHNSNAAIRIFLVAK